MLSDIMEYIVMKMDYYVHYIAGIKILQVKLLISIL